MQQPPAPDSAMARLTIDLGAVRHNWRYLSDLARPASAAAVVKADAYGLGAARVAGTLVEAGCRDLFVAHLAEAAALVPALEGAARLYVLNGLPPGAEAKCAALGAIPVLNALDQMSRWAALGRERGTALPAAIQFDTGMARLGMPAEEVERLIARPALLEGVRPVLVMSHLACGDDPQAAANDRQRTRFEALAAVFPGVRRSLANSGGTFLPGMKHDLVRPGIALYGGAPQAGLPNPMRGVVGLEARIIQVRHVPQGEGVGYGLEWTAARPSRIATIGVGYADGWPRTLGNCGAAFIAGRRVPIAGRVSMDSLTLDVTDIPEFLLEREEYPVELLGPHQSIDDVARDAGTIAYEILTRLGHRYARLYLGADQGSTKP